MVIRDATLEPTVPIVLFVKLIVTKPVPELLTVPEIAQLVSVIVIGVSVLYVRLPVIVTPVRFVGVACNTLAVTELPENIAPFASVTVPDVVRLPVNVDDLAVIVEPATTKTAVAVAAIVTFHLPP